MLARARLTAAGCKVGKTLALLRATTLAMTRPETALAAAAEVVVPIAIPEDAKELMPTAFRYTHIAVLDIIDTGLASEMGMRSLESLRRVRYTLANVGVAIPSLSSDPTPLMKQQAAGIGERRTRDFGGYDGRTSAERKRCERLA